MPVITRRAVVDLVAAAMGSAALASLADSDGHRVISAYGFSFLPPQGSGWHERFENQQITYFKETDPAEVSFFMGALDGKLRSKLTTNDELVAFVRSKKDQWGSDGRYSDISVSFTIDNDTKSCVRYRMKAHDRYAKNKGDNAFLIMQSIGQFCVHPKDRSNAVDIYYSVRYVPSFDPKSLIAEGEVFLNSLRIQNPR